MHEEARRRIGRLTLELDQPEVNINCAGWTTRGERDGIAHRVVRLLASGRRRPELGSAGTTWPRIAEREPPQRLSIDERSRKKSGAWCGPSNVSGVQRRVRERSARTRPLQRLVGQLCELRLVP